MNEAQAKDISQSVKELKVSQAQQSAEIAVLSRVQTQILERMEKGDSEFANLRKEIANVRTHVHSEIIVLKDYVRDSIKDVTDSLTQSINKANKSLEDSVTLLASTVSTTAENFKKFRMQLTIGVIGAMIGAVTIVVIFAILFAIVTQDADFLKEFSLKLLGLL